MQPSPTQQAPTGPLQLVFGNGKSVPLLKERKFLRDDIPELFPSTGDPAVAVVRESPQDRNIIGLTNCSKTTWNAVMPDGRQLTIEPSKSVRLVPGMVVHFSAHSQAQVQPLSSAAAFVASKGRTILMSVIGFLLVGALIVALTRKTPDTTAQSIENVNRAQKAVFLIHAEVGQQAGEGSGFFIDDQGHALTNNHVTMGAETVTVVLPGGTQTTAKVLKTDATLDVSLIKVEKTTGVFLKMVSPTELKIGEEIWTIGYPLGGQVSKVESSVAKGVYTGLRDVNQVFGPLGIKGYEGSQILQTDANVNHGNSGGAMVNANGDVVAVTRLIYRDLEVAKGQFQAVTGLNYGISIDEVRKRFLPGTECDGLALK
jgi:S1-C subfamily serine protease